MFMTTASQSKKAGDEKHWRVKNEQGETFGPVDFETLKLWAKDGRLAPTNTLSEDATTWNAITHYPALEMDWVAEVSPGAFYGPIHKLALEALQKEGALPAHAVTFQRPIPVRSAAKTQPIATMVTVSPPPPTIDTDALRALERQLDLERQRSHDIMKELQQIEVLVATAEARAETSEHALERQLDLERQRSQDIMKELRQVEAHVATAEARVETSEKAHQHAAAQAEQAQQHLFNKLESLLQDYILRFGNQQQEILSVVTSTQPRIDVLPTKESASSPSNVETQRILLNAITQAQSHIVNQVTQHVNNTLAQTQEQMRTTASATHDQLDALTQAQSLIVNQVAQQVGDALTQTHEQMRTTAATTHDRLDVLAQAQSLIVKQVTQQLGDTLTQTQEQMRTTASTTHDQLDALAQAQSLIVNQVAQQVGDALMQTHEQMRTTASATHDQLNALAQAQSLIVKQVTQQLGDALMQTHEQMRTTASATHEQTIQRMVAEHEQTCKQFAVALASAQTHIMEELSQSFISEFAKAHAFFKSALLSSQQEATAQTTHIVTQATAPITTQLTQHGQELERFGALINTSRTQTADTVVRAVADLLAKGREDLFKKMGSELTSGRDQLFERLNTVLTHGREQMMRATGDSQRIAIEYIVREFHASQQRLEAELKATLEQSMKTASKPVVERTYIKAEHVEVLPPERPHKKPHPEPEPIKPPPPPPAEHTGATKATGSGLSMADLEQQARRELERLGAQGMNIFKRKQ
jgi:hypothetical protein